MAWQDQGRQEHGWFGDGTSPNTATPDPSVAGQSLADRSVAIAYGAIGALPAPMRRRVELQYSHGTLSQFADAMTSWMRGTRLDQAKFASLFFGRSADDPVAQALHAAALAGALAQNHADMRQASEDVAKAIGLVGADQWARFVVDAQARANDPATAAAVQSSRKIDTSRSDAIRPVYPLETLIGLGAAGSVANAARIGVGAALRQVIPDTKPTPKPPLPMPIKQRPMLESPIEAPSTSPALSTEARTPPADNATETVSDPLKPPPISRQKQDGHIAGTPQHINRLKENGIASTFDGTASEADDLVREAWQKGMPDEDRPHVRDHDFQRRIGTGPRGGGQSKIRVHQDTKGRIHGHPSGREIP